MPSDLVDAMNPMRKAALDGIAHLERSQDEDGWVPMQRESLAAIKQHVADLEAALREAASALRAGAEPVLWIDPRSLEAADRCRGDDHNGYAQAWMRPDERRTTPLYTRPQPATPASGDGIAGRVNGYLPRQRAVEVVMDAPLPAWITGNPNVRVTIVPTPPASKGGE